MSWWGKKSLYIDLNFVIKFVRKGANNSKSAFVQVKALHQTDGKSLTVPMET